MGTPLDPFAFPFGRPGRAAPTPARAAELVVLGAYPSALHVRWEPPKPLAPIKAFAVEIEPHAFWNGADEAERIEAWKRAVGWRETWGRAVPARRLNGSSGVWVDERVLRPLKTARDSAWITDCLHWYCHSEGNARRTEDTYRPFAKEHGLPESRLPSHPSEDEIVRQAVDERPRPASALWSSRRPRSQRPSCRGLDATRNDGVAWGSPTKSTDASSSPSWPQSVDAERPSDERPATPLLRLDDDDSAERT